MKKRIKYILVSIIALIGCCLYAHVDVTYNMYDSQVDSSMYLPIAVEENVSVSETFISEEKVLDGINVKIGVNSVSMQGDFIYSVYNDGVVVAEGKLPLADIKSGRFNKIKFDNKLEKYENEEYVITFSTEGLEKGESIVLYYLLDESDEREICVGDEKIKGDLILKTITHRFNVETFIVVLGIIIYFVVFFRILYKLFS